MNEEFEQSARRLWPDDPGASPQRLNAPHAVSVYITVGDDGKAVLSGREPIVSRVMGTKRRGLYPRPGEWLWVPGQCLEGIDHIMGFVPPPCDPVACTLSVTPLPGETAAG
jgi:hypothetical protein